MSFEEVKVTSDNPELMMEQQYYSDKYFNGVNPKYLKHYWFVTRGGNHCTCWISTKTNHQLGSMVITTVNDEPTEQYVQGMSKLHYYHNYLGRLEESDKPIRLYEKLDGTNICLYRLYLPGTRHTIEVVPKSRSLPVLNDDYQALYDSLDTGDIEDLVELPNGISSMCFELYGRRNKHLVDYKYPDLSLKLIAVYGEDGGLLDSERWFELARDMGVSHARLVGEYGDEGFKRYYMDSVGNPDEPGSVSEYLGYVEDIMQDLNMDSDDFIVEGCVLNTWLNGQYKQFKCKPDGVREVHTCGDGSIPVKVIRKECFKVFEDIPSSDVEIILKEDFGSCVEYVQECLLEEYSEDLVECNKTKGKIENVLVDIMSELSISEDIMTIARRLVDENPYSSVVELMKVFAREYSYLRSKSNLMYNAINKIKKNEE